MALNKVILMGRITHDLEIRQTPAGKAVLTFSVAVDRYSKGGDDQADFISCVAWEQKAEFIGRYFGRGRMIAIEGQLRTRTYEDKHGSKHYVTEVFVDDVAFTGEPRQMNENAPQSGGHAAPGNYTGWQEQASQGASQNFTPGDMSEFEDVISDDGVPF